MLKLKYEGFKFSHCMHYAMSLLFNQNFYFRQSVVIFFFYVKHHITLKGQNV